MTPAPATKQRAVRPTRQITDPKFKWRFSYETDVARTWRKFRLLQRLQGAAA
jgi:hypothetical protein